jgi:DNA-directed RNA polymerase subunit RPC12/RpoP
MSMTSVACPDCGFEFGVKNKDTDWSLKCPVCGGDVRPRRVATYRGEEGLLDTPRKPPRWLWWAVPAAAAAVVVVVVVVVACSTQRGTLDVDQLTAQMESKGFVLQSADDKTVRYRSRSKDEMSVEFDASPSLDGAVTITAQIQQLDGWKTRFVFDATNDSVRQVSQSVGGSPMRALPPGRDGLDETGNTFYAMWKKSLRK